MSSTPLRCLGLALMTLLLTVAPVLADGPTPPPYYAIHDVTVITGDGERIEGATVLLADGLIENVGVGLSIPGDAWRIDGSGLLLYPGLFDGLSNLGQTKAEEGSSRPGPGDDSSKKPPIRGPEDRPATTPWLQAADNLGDDDRIAKWREAGFTTAISAPEDGLFAGQAAVIHLGDAEARDRVLTASVAQRLNFSGPRRQYPGSLMGVLAYIGQVFSDSQHYSRAQAAYESGGYGVERPVHDRTLEALEASRRLPFLLPADEGREIHRALTMAREWQIRPILYGVRGG